MQLATGGNDNQPTNFVEPVVLSSSVITVPAGNDSAHDGVAGDGFAQSTDPYTEPVPVPLVSIVSVTGPEPPELPEPITRLCPLPAATCTALVIPEGSDTSAGVALSGPVIVAFPS